VTKDLIKGKIEERADGLVPHLVLALDSLNFESEEINEA
jgi:hypothetical protein